VGLVKGVPAPSIEYATDSTRTIASLLFSGTASGRSFGKFYYEIAQANHTGAPAALMDLVRISKVLFGNDYPLRPISEAVQGAAKYSYWLDLRKSLSKSNGLVWLFDKRKVTALFHHHETRLRQVPFELDSIAGQRDAIEASGDH